MIEVKPLLPEHAKAILSIYEEGLQTGAATFNTVAPSWQEWDAGYLAHTRLVAVSGDWVLGWAALLPVSARPCYCGVAECSIYVTASRRGKGIGDLLMKAMIAESEVNGIWTLQSATLEKNKASMALQEKMGFRIVGYRERIAQLNGQWLNTVILERRSGITGN